MDSPGLGREPVSNKGTRGVVLDGTAQCKLPNRHCANPIKSGHALTLRGNFGPWGRHRGAWTQAMLGTPHCPRRVKETENWGSRWSHSRGSALELPVNRTKRSTPSLAARSPKQTAGGALLLQRLRLIKANGQGPAMEQNQVPADRGRLADCAPKWFMPCSSSL